MSLSIESIRALTPGVESRVHMNNAGHSPAPRTVFDAIERYLRWEQDGGYEAVVEHQSELDGVYGSIARLIGCHSEEIALVESGTQAWNTALRAIAWRAGDVVLIGRSEYGSNVIHLAELQRDRGITVQVIENDEFGQISIAALRAAISDRVKLIALTHTPTNGGLVNPAAEVGRVAREHGILYLLDAVQTVGQLPVSVEEIGCDLLAATGRKYLRGPRGTGFLYVRKDVLEKLRPHSPDNFGANWRHGSDGHGHIEYRAGTRRFECYESSHALRYGLGAAVDYALSLGVDTTWKRVESLAEQLRIRLREDVGATVHDLGAVRGGLVSFTLEGRDPAAIKAELRNRGINVSVSWSSTTPYDMAPRNLPALVRASVHYFNTEAEVDKLCTALQS